MDRLRVCTELIITPLVIYVHELLSIPERRRVGGGGRGEGGLRWRGECRERWRGESREKSVQCVR